MPGSAPYFSCMTHIDGGAGRGLLSQLGIIRISGPDAATFLQGQLSNDTRRLSENRPLLAAFSSPQGRVLALLHLFPHSSGVLAVLPRELVAGTLERLRRYVLRAKLKLEDACGQFAVGGQFETRAEALYVEQAEVGEAAVAHDASRRWILGPAAALAARGLAASPEFEAAWRRADVQAGLPQVYLATSESFVAQMLNLDRLDAISFSKGCYTGQEIIARTQHLGRIKRRMFHLALPAGDWQVGQALRLKDGRSGRLTEVIGRDDGAEVLAVLSTEAGADGGDGDAASVAAREIPLPYGLEPAA